MSSAMAHHCGSIPENSNVVPSQWCRHNRGMDDKWSGRVAEVEKCEVEEVGDQEQLALPEESSDPKHNESEGQKVMLYLINNCSSASVVQELGLPK